MSEKGTEQATEQRKDKARKQGDVVRSRELLSAVAMLAGLLTLGASANQLFSTWSDVYHRSLRLGTADLATEDLSRAISRIVAPSLLPLGLVLAASAGAALAAGIAQSEGIQMRGEALAFKLERLNPVTNLGNLFSMRTMVRMAKSLVPATIVVILGTNALRVSVLPMPVTSVARLPATLALSLSLATETAWILLIWSAFDYAMERRAWNRKLRMTKQEYRDEMKETMGNPQVKGRMRRIQNAMRHRKVKADVSRASVVITNPTHYAVALMFSFESMQAPTLLTKGRNLHAFKIREEARWAGVPIVENPPLARSLYKSVAEGQAIPFELYAAVAGILAYLYRQQVEKAVRERKAAEEAGKAASSSSSIGPHVGGQN